MAVGAQPGEDFRSVDLLGRESRRRSIVHIGYVRSPQSGTASRTTEALEDRCLLSVAGVEGSPVTVSQVFTDVGVLDSDTATINWGDGNTTPGTVVAAPGGSDTVTGSHVYADNGEYTVTITVN